VNLSFWTDPWQSPTILWLAVTAALTSIACGLPGTFLVLRRMSLTGDAISHSVLPGIVIGFFVSGSLDSPLIILGAAFSGWLTVMLIEFFHRKAGVREDAATGVVFTAMFSIGVLLLRQYAGKVDLDPDCILFGNLETAIHGTTTRVLGFEVPNITLTSAVAATGAILFITLLYHRLLATSFDPVLSKLTGQAPVRAQSILLGATAAAVVAAFQTVGAVMSVALLVLPAASSLLVFKRLPGVIAGVILHAILSSIGGIYLATWAHCNLGAAIILSGGILFICSFLRFNHKG
jgi:manganese/zinc/iron transport system permease protein